MTNTPYLTALLLVAITFGNVCLSAASQPLSKGDSFTDKFLTSISVDCSSEVDDDKCLDWMLEFKWPLSVPSYSHGLPEPFCVADSFLS
jgi:hypothetical protein